MKQQSIVDAVRSKRAEFRWVELQPGIEVFHDAMKVDGVRVNVTAQTAQRIADLLGASLTTPALEDMIFQLAEIRIPPHTIATGPDGTWEQTLWHSHMIDLDIAKYGITNGMLVATVGKSWVLVNELLEHRGQACNYGWHGNGAPHQPATGTVRVWQPIGFMHNISHVDYSQCLRLIRLRGDAFLPTHDGQPLRVKRQPGVMFERDTEPNRPAMRPLTLTDEDVEAARAERDASIADEEPES